MPEEKPIHQTYLQVHTKLEDLTEVLQWFERAIKQCVPEAVFWQCQVALAEGFTNTVRHAHRNLPATTPIELKVDLFARSLEICIWNFGQPFDLEAALRALPREKEQLLYKEDGRGLFFMEQLTDELRYVRTDNGRNCLIMRKQF
ncbi:MAG: ATP-binding protein [Chloroflexaceae bacterium]|nr:ATP-binding protein [Chloroflexaceae bacterium]